MLENASMNLLDNIAGVSLGSCNGEKVKLVVMSTKKCFYLYDHITRCYLIRLPLGVYFTSFINLRYTSRQAK